MKKMTKKDWFMALENIVDMSSYEDKEGIKAFIEHEINLLSRKSSNSSMTKTQKENVNIMAVIEAVLADFGKPVTITEMMADERLSAYSNQKLSALLRQMPNVVKTVNKRRSYFSLADNGPKEIDA